MPGVRKNGKKWEAFLGKKILGNFDTKKEAEDCYDENAKKIFKFPILNSEIQKPDDTGTEN